MSNERYSHKDVRTAFTVFVKAVNAMTVGNDMDFTIHYGNGPMKYPYMLKGDSGRLNVIVGRTAYEATNTIYAMTAALQFVKETNTP